MLVACRLAGISEAHYPGPPSLASSSAECTRRPPTRSPSKVWARPRPQNRPSLGGSTACPSLDPAAPLVPGQQIYQPPRVPARWIPTRSATPSTALVPQRKVGFPIPNAGLLLGFQGTKTARREGISSPFSDAGGCTSPQNSGPPSSGACLNHARPAAAGSVSSPIGPGKTPGSIPGASASRRQGF